MRTHGIRAWLLITGSLVIAAAYCAVHLRSGARANPRAVASAEDEVYEVVVRDMVTPIHEQARISLLAFDDSVLTELKTGEDVESCKERVGTNLRLGSGAPPYNSLADKLYRLLTLSKYDEPLETDAIEDFIQQSCTTGRLSETFHTDLPRTFIASESLSLGRPVGSTRPKRPQQMFPGIISLSHVGFDSTLRNAVVSTAFACGILCGSSTRYVLTKKEGRWKVVGKRELWVS